MAFNCILWFFWYISQWSGWISSIFCTRLYSKDIHCDPHAHRTYFDSVRHTQLHTSLCTHTRMCVRTFFFKFIYFLFFYNCFYNFFYYMCIDLWQEKWKMDVRTKKVLYARIRMHIFKAPSAPECTKIAAPACVRAHARTHTKGLAKTVTKQLTWPYVSLHRWRMLIHNYLKYLIASSSWISKDGVQLYIRRI